MVSQDFENAYTEASNLKNASQDDMLEVRASTHTVGQHRY